MNQEKKNLQYNYFPNTLSVYEELNQNIYKEIANNINHNQDFSISLERAYLPLEIQNIHGDIEDKFDSMGYIEEDDEDENKENIDETFFNFENFSTVKKDGLLYTPINASKSNPLPIATQVQKISHLEKNSGNIDIMERSSIKTQKELDEIFRGLNNYNVIYSNLLDEKVILNQENNKKNLTLLKAEQILIILKYIYEVLHPFLIDLSDQLLIERLKYFGKDDETYISIIKQYLTIKDKTFTYILEDIMKKLNISEEIIDSSFEYYIGTADKNIKIVKDINMAYDNIINADYK